MENRDIQSELEWDERISSYMKGHMDSQEEKQFLSEMESDNLLRKDAITQARLVRGMQQADDELIRALKNSSETEVSSLLRPRKSPLKKPIVWLSMVASIAIILVVGYRGYDYYNTTRFGMKYATAFPMETIVRGDSDSSVDSELLALFNNVVERKNLGMTTDRLSELWRLSNEDTYNDYTDYAPYIGWYLAIGYLEDNNKEKAQCILDTMLDDENVSISIKGQIKEILKRL